MKNKSKYRWLGTVNNYAQISLKSGRRKSAQGRKLPLIFQQ